MRKILYLNNVASYPVAELHAAQKDEIKNSTDFTLVSNSFKTRHNHFNPLGRPLTFIYEKHRANSVAKFLNVPLNEIKIRKNQPKLSAEVMERLEIGVMSSLASYLRIIHYDQLNKNWRRIHKDLLENSIKIYNYFFNELQYYDQIIIYNGRFCEDSAARLAAEMTKKSYKVFDFKKAGSYYEFIDVPLHSTVENCNRAKSYYLENIKTAHYIAAKFMDSKINGISTYEKSYTKKQIHGGLDLFKKNNQKIIAVYPSSDDEYRFLGNDWGIAAVDSQVEEILNLAKSTSAEFQIVVRLHPNMIDMQKDQYNEYLKLDNVKKITIIPADSTISTYELLDIAQYIVGFCSTVLAEANYMGKTTIGIGGNPYYHLPISNYVETGSMAGELINEGKLLRKSKTASIIWMNYLWKYSQKNKYINDTTSEKNNARGSEFKFQLRNSHPFRLLCAIDRLELRLKRKSKISRANLREMRISITDIILNKSSNKFIDVEKN